MCKSHFFTKLHTCCLSLLQIMKIKHAHTMTQICSTCICNVYMWSHSQHTSTSCTIYSVSSGWSMGSCSIIYLHNYWLATGIESLHEKNRLGVEITTGYRQLSSNSNLQLSLTLTQGVWITRSLSEIIFTDNYWCSNWAGVRTNNNINTSKAPSASPTTITV